MNKHKDSTLRKRYGKAHAIKVDLFRVERMPSLAGEPREWQVSAPDGSYFVDYGPETHALVAFSLAETRRLQTLRVEPCASDCSCRDESP